MIANELRTRRTNRRGVAMIPTLLAVAGLSIFALALLMSVVTTKRSANNQADEYKLSSTVESVAMLATEKLWSGYLDKGDGTAGNITSFRNYLTGLGIQNSPNPAPPKTADGTDVLPLLNLPVVDGKTTFHDVTVENLKVWRKDVGDATQLYLTIAATSTRGAGLINPNLQRSLQQVYTVEPEEFDGFDYAVLANNINCIFCHTQVDSVDRVYNTSSSKYGDFERVKVGALETLMLRHTQGVGGAIGDWDADSNIAGTLYVRGTVTDADGDSIADWSDLAFQSYEFDSDGTLVEIDPGVPGGPGVLTSDPFSPAGFPPAKGENLYLEYPTDYAEMVDGNLPPGFPPPIPDDGGINPATGLPDPASIENKIIDDFEFDALAAQAVGTISAGKVTLVADGDTLDLTGYTAAITPVPGEVGTYTYAPENGPGNLVLTGTEDNPIIIDGTVVVDGDLIIHGYVKGQGTLVARGNIYVPSDLEYLDGEMFGYGADSKVNALGMAAGGNVLVGDYLAPSTTGADLSLAVPPKFSMVDGSPTPTAPGVNPWNFTLAEMSLFNRGEWAKTQAFLPSVPGSADDLGDGITPVDPATGFPVTWAPNPSFDEDYIPRYYQFGEDDVVPIYNKGDLYFDDVTGSWHGDAEVPLSWDTDLLTLADPTDTADPYLFPAAGPAPVLVQITPDDGWIPDDVYKAGIEFYEDSRPVGKPLTVDGLLYTNNAIFSLVSRYDGPYAGQMTVNGSLIAADIGMLAPGVKDPWGLAPNPSPLSDYAIGLQLNYDKRLKNMLNVKNPLQVQLKRTLWNPTAHLQ
jgi:hypothetical protein